MTGDMIPVFLFGVLIGAAVFVVIMDIRLRKAAEEYRSLEADYESMKRAATMALAAASKANDLANRRFV